MLTVEIEYCLPGYIRGRSWWIDGAYRTKSNTAWGHHAIHFRVLGYAMRFTVQWGKRV